MKNVSYIVVVSFLAFIMQSCSKTKSVDTAIPKVSKEAIYICTDNNNLISYNPSTGVKEWEVILKGVSDGVPVLYERKLYVVTNNGYFYAIDVITHKVSKEEYIGKFTTQSIAVDKGLVYIASDSFYCYTSLGVRLWAYDPAAPSCTSAPQIANGRAYFSAQDKIHAVDLNTGNAIWISAAIGPGVSSSPRVSNGLVYFGGNDNVIYALKEFDGSLQWSYLTGDKIVSSPIVYGGMCILGSLDYGVYCMDTTSAPPFGLLRWKLPTLDRVSSSPTVHEASNTILVGSYDFNLYAIDHVSGTLNWKYPSGSLIKSSPLVYKDYVYFTSYDRYLYCVDIKKGGLVWKSFLNGNTQSSPMADDTKIGYYPGISGMSKY